MFNNETNEPSFVGGGAKNGSLVPLQLLIARSHRRRLFAALMSEPIKYSEQYRSPRWQQRRLLTMQRDDFKCRDCGNASDFLNVHHEYYITGRDIWSYPDWALVTLCELCHEARHNSPNDATKFEENFAFAVNACGNHEGWIAICGQFMAAESGRITPDELAERVRDFFCKLGGKQ